MAITAIRTVIIYLFIIVALRVTGKRQIGELQPVELVVTLLISDLAVIPMQESDIPLVTGLIPIAVLVCMELILSTLMMKSNGLSTLISGHPVVIIRNGVLQQKALRQLRLGVDDLTEALRQQKVFDLKQVECALVETSGKISVFTRHKNGEHPAVPVINDGQPVEWGLSYCDLTPQWLEEVLAAQGHSMEQVLLMTADRSGRYTVIRKETSA